MSPTNEQELEIARIVDRIDLDGKLSIESIRDVVNSVDFMMTASDGEFLGNYIQWRLDHPIAK